MKPVKVVMITTSKGCDENGKITVDFNIVVDVDCVGRNTIHRTLVYGENDEVSVTAYTTNGTVRAVHKIYLKDAIGDYFHISVGLDKYFKSVKIGNSVFIIFDDRDEPKNVLRSGDGGFMMYMLYLADLYGTDYMNKFEIATSEAGVDARPSIIITTPKFIFTGWSGGNLHKIYIRDINKVSVMDIKHAIAFEKIVMTGVATTILPKEGE